MSSLISVVACDTIHAWCGTFYQASHRDQDKCRSRRTPRLPLMHEGNVAFRSMTHTAPMIAENRGSRMPAAWYLHYGKKVWLRNLVSSILFTPLQRALDIGQCLNYSPCWSRFEPVSWWVIRLPRTLTTHMLVIELIHYLDSPFSHHCATRIPLSMTDPQIQIITACAVRGQYSLENSILLSLRPP